MCLKFSFSPYTMLRTNSIARRKFCSLVPSILLRGGRGGKIKIVQITVFPIIFVTDCLKNLQSFKCGILQLLILNQIEDMHLPITSLLYKSYNFWNPNKQLEYLDK